MTMRYVLGLENAMNIAYTLSSQYDNIESHFTIMILVCTFVQITCLRYAYFLLQSIYVAKTY